MKFSIIVPVFNTEKYLEHCLNSIMNQDIDDYEVIIVNDGSMDASQNICESYIARYHNIKLLNQNNAGQSAARNRGLSLANGEYIIFVDSDDYIAEHTLGNIYQDMVDRQLDVLTFSQKRYTSQGKYIEYRKPLNMLPETVFSGSEYITKYGFHVLISPWMYIYRKDFIDYRRFQFAEGLYHEDCEWTAHWFPYAKKIGYKDIYFYHQVLSENSTMRSKDLKKARDLIEISGLIHADAEDMKSNFSDKVIKEIHQYGAFEAWSAISSCVRQGYPLKELFYSPEDIKRLLDYLHPNLRYRGVYLLMKLKQLRLIEVIIKILYKVRGTSPLFF